MTGMDYTPTVITHLKKKYPTGNKSRYKLSLAGAVSNTMAASCEKQAYRVEIASDRHRGSIN
jgi:hypothetical protein